MSYSYDDFENMKDSKGHIRDFFEIVKIDLDIIDNQKADELMWIAWEHGHAYGYYEVYLAAIDMVRLIK